MAKVLVIEDDASIRESLRDFLELELHEVHLACHGAEGIAHLEASLGDFQLVLCDLSMPVMNGYEFLAKKLEHQKWRDIPTLVLTGEPNIVGIEEMVLRKPLDLKKLTWAMDQVMQKASVDKGRVISNTSKSS